MKNEHENKPTQERLHYIEQRIAKARGEAARAAAGGHTAWVQIATCWDVCAELLEAMRDMTTLKVVPPPGSEVQIVGQIAHVKPGSPLGSLDDEALGRAVVDAVVSTSIRDGCFPLDEISLSALAYSPVATFRGIGKSMRKELEQ